MNKTYPIYEIKARWQYVAGELLASNGTSLTVMERKILTNKQTEQKLKKFKQAIIAREKEKGRMVVGDIEIVSMTMTHDTWALGWFTHNTFNLFETEEEAFKDFQEYVDRKSAENLKNGHEIGYSRIGKDKPYTCLMGAEDRWRWKLCGCDICKEQGTTIIMH